MSITKILTDKLSAAFAECGYSAELGTVVTSDRPDLCQFQCNGAFAGAKLYHKAPRMIAADAAAMLEGDADLEKVEVVGAGFINITVSDEFLLGYVKQALADENLGIPQAEKPETVVLDYGGPNVAKPLHIGHLRSAVIGEALKRLVRATGRKTISDVHLGDWGLQMGLVMAAGAPPRVGLLCRRFRRGELRGSRPRCGKPKRDIPLREREEQGK